MFRILDSIIKYIMF